LSAYAERFCEGVPIMSVGFAITTSPLWIPLSATVTIAHEVAVSEGGSTETAWDEATPMSDRRRPFVADAATISADPSALAAIVGLG
jgi:hypothetical protein